MRNIIYSKYSNERAEQFKIRTDIVQDEKRRKFVQKTALTPEAGTHIENIYKYYELLQEIYEGSTICMNKCYRTDTGLEFEYIEGKTLEEELDELLFKKNYIQLVDRIKEYVGTIGGEIVQYNFEQTEEFIKVFGNVKLPLSLRCAKVNNIDLIFSNIILSDKWHIIDYEWTFNFLIPFNYIVYRAIHYYIYSSSKRSEVINLGLYKLLGITDEEIVQYDNMERSFQAYMLGSLVPLRNLYGTTTGMNVNIQEVMESQVINTSQNQVQVFYDYGEGFSESQSYQFNPKVDNNGEIDFEIPITRNVRQVRVDPANNNCIVNINSVIGYSTQYYMIDYLTNGIRLNEKTILFATSDPQIMIMDIRPGTTRLELKLEVQVLSKQITVELCEFSMEKEKILQSNEQVSRNNKQIIQDNERVIREKEKTLRDKDNYLKRLNYESARLKEELDLILKEKEGLNNQMLELIKINQNQDHYISEVKATKVWRLYTLYKKLMNNK